MKNTYYLPALAALLAAAPAARAQQAWQPFRANTTYQYTEGGTPGDTTHTLRMGNGTAATTGSPDTVYRFNRRAPKVQVQDFWRNAAAYQLVADNLFGTTLRVQPGAVFVFAAANGRSLTLRPRAPLGQNWNAGPNNLTAHVMSRSLVPVPGGGTDSATAIMFSDGQVLTLSKRHGLLDGPSLDSYLNGRNRRRSLSLTGREGSATAPLLTGARATYNFQPGDLLQRHGTTTFSSGSTCTETWEQDSILTRTVTRAGDTVRYTIRTRSLYRAYGQAGAPSGFCSSMGSSYLVATPTVVVTDDAAGNRLASSLTNAFAVATSTAGGGASGQVIGAACRSTRYFRRPEWEQQTCNMPNGLTADSTRLQGTVDYGTTTRYAVGLGITRIIGNSYNETTVKELVAYRKGPEVWGTFFSFRQLLAARATRRRPAPRRFRSPAGPI